MKMLYIFDLDGTLVDSLIDLREATEYALKEMNYPGYDLESYQYFVGNGVKKLIQRAFKTDEEAIYQKARALFDQYYTKHCLDHTVAYDGLIKMIANLKNQGHFIGVVTNKPDELAKKICNGIYRDQLDFVQGQIEQIPVKPNPYFVLRALEEYHIDQNHCIFIGDSNVDILTGKNSGVRTIGVTWGNRTRAELSEAGADWIVDDVLALERLLREAGC